MTPGLTRKSGRWLVPLLSRCLVAMLALATIGGAATAQFVRLRAQSPEDLSGLRYRAVLIAGDKSAAAFDHATEAMRDRLLAAGIPASDIQILSATAAERARLSTLDNVLSAIEHLRPAAGQGCLVFATSHGAFDEGLVL